MSKSIWRCQFCDCRSDEVERIRYNGFTEGTLRSTCTELNRRIDIPGDNNFPDWCPLPRNTHRLGERVLDEIFNEIENI